MTSDTQNTLVLKDIKKAYNLGQPNEVQVLNGLSLSVARGEIVGLIAPSGTGKTTLLNVAGLLDKVDEGNIVIDGQDMTYLGDKERTAARRDKIGFVYQFHHLLPEFTALENIMIPQFAADVSEKDAKTRSAFLLEAVGLKDRMKHRPNALSGGEAQRVAICRALANQPKLLLADEPTGNLDTENSLKVFEMLLEIARKEGMAALIATHNLALAEKMDRIIELR